MVETRLVVASAHRAIWITRASSGAPDVPTTENSEENDETNQFDAVAGLVKNVSEGWCCHMADKSTLALFIPAKDFRTALSREHFVDLLEYCEEVLHCRRVLACFNRSDIGDPRQGIPRALHCIGFTPLAPQQFPPGIDAKSIFAMVYNV